MTLLALINLDGAPLYGDSNPTGLSASERANLTLLGAHRHVALTYAIPPELFPAFPQPQTIDGQTWIAGRIRLDRKAALLEKLSQSGEQSAIARTDIRCQDARICLAAYAKWGEAFLERISGDYSFVIWDSSKQIMLCARDRLGVRLLFYFRSGQHVCISDSLERLAAIGDAAGKLDEMWIADFLGSSVSSDPERSVYSAIRRIIPGHILRIADGQCEHRRYWSLQIGEPRYHTSQKQCIDEFHHLLSMSITDRMPDGRVGISLSGGLDSSTLAAKAVECGGASRVVAQSRVFRSIIRDDEESFSKLVSDRLSIRHEVVAMDATYYLPGWCNETASPPEPSTSITSYAAEKLLAERMAETASVWFYGEGPDNALSFDWRPYLRWLWRSGIRGRALVAGLDLVSATKGAEWQMLLRRLIERRRLWIPAAVPVLPDWIDERFAAETGLKDRMRASHEARSSAHPWRPRAMASFASPIWQRLFDTLDPTHSKLPVEWRHPYLEAEMLQFLLELPPVPWSRDKKILRDAMRGILPDEVLRRPKTPLQGNPDSEILRRNPLPSLPAGSPVFRYVKQSRLAAHCESEIYYFELLKIYVLDHWLRQRGYG